MQSMNKNKIILDLCGGTGSWSKPYKEAGYDVRVITIPEHDVRTYTPPEGVYGILAAPPCTMFSYARTNAKTLRDFEDAMSVVEACLKIIWKLQYKPISNYAKYTRLKFWAMENPYFGLLRNFIGRPCYTFDPWEFGDAYKKRTALWGNFKDPIKTFKAIGQVLTYEQIEQMKTNSRKLPKFDMLSMAEIKRLKSPVDSEPGNKKTRQALRSITPQGFAQAFFKANQ